MLVMPDWRVPCRRRPDTAHRRRGPLSASIDPPAVLASGRERTRSLQAHPEVDLPAGGEASAVEEEA